MVAANEASRFDLIETDESKQYVHDLLCPPNENDENDAN
tara:strand:- start:124 stop:240 length:117 start_codon:yes stop_codon:yes gene_type:complete